MTQTSYPFENQDTTESQYSALFSEFTDTGVAGDDINNTAITCAPTGTGLNLQLTPGFAIIRGFAYNLGTNLTVTCDPANTQARIDTVILRLDPVANSIVAAIKKGTPGASPSAPALTQTVGGVWEFPIGDILVNANATVLSPANYTDRRTFLGAQVGLWTTATRPSGPDSGRVGFNKTTGKMEWYNPATSSWSTNTPFDVNGANITDGTIANSKLTTKPGTYPQVLTSSSTSISLTDSTNSNGLVVTTAATAVSISVAAAALAPNQRIDFIQDGAGQITFSAGAGATLQASGGKLKTKGQYSAATIVCTASGQLRLIGDVVA